MRKQSNLETIERSLSKAWTKSSRVRRGKGGGKKFAGCAPLQKPTRALISTAALAAERRGRSNIHSLSRLNCPAQVLWTQLPRGGLGEAQRVLSESEEGEAEEKRERGGMCKKNRGSVSLVTLWSKPVNNALKFGFDFF